MACERFAGQLKDAAAGGEPAAELLAHVERCESCREALAAERRLVASIADDFMRAVRVEPSADFEARVRMRVAARPAATSWFGGWRLAASLASFAVVAVLLTVLVIHRGETDQRWPQTVAGTPAATSPERARVEPVVPPPPRDDVSSPEGSHSAARGRAASVAVVAANVRRAAPREPEVIVAQDQQLVIARLFGMLRRGTLDEKALEQPSEAPQPPAPIVVGELTVAPIVVAPTGNEKQH